MSKKCRFLIYLILFCGIFAFIFNTNSNNTKIYCYATELEDSLKSEIKEQTEDLDLSAIEEIYKTQDDPLFLKYNNFKEFLLAIISGEEQLSLDYIINIFKDSLKSSFKSFLPTVVLIFILAFIYNFFSRTSFAGGTNKVVYLLCYISIVFLIINIAKQSVGKVETVMNVLQKQMNAVFPVLITLMCAVGATVTVGVYKPIVAFLTVFISNIAINVLLPIVLYCLIFSVVGRLSDEIKLNKLISLLKSVFKWIVGVCFSLYMGFLSVKAITASGVDGISIKATKYAIKNYIPYLGGFISEGFEVVRAGSTLIKNSVGIGSIVLMIAYVLVPIISLVALSLILKVASAITEPLSDGKISGFLSDVSLCVSMLVACLICVCVMYLVTIILIISTANYVF